MSTGVAQAVASVDVVVPHLHILDHPATAPRSTGPAASDAAAPASELPVVVLVHGSLDRAASFTRVVRRLADLHVVTYDRRGYAGSRGTPPGDDPFGEHVADLLRVIDGRRAVVVGHSLGGDVAVGAALADPRLVAAIAAYEPPMPWLPWWPRRDRGALAAAGPALHAEQFFRRMVSDQAWERSTDRARAERIADGPALLAELLAIRSSDPPFEVSALQVPATFCRGERSAGHHRRAVQELATAVRGARMVEIAGAAHGAHLTHAGAFASMVRATVARAANPDAP